MMFLVLGNVMMIRGGLTSPALGFLLQAHTNACFARPYPKSAQRRRNCGIFSNANPVADLLAGDAPKYLSARMIAAPTRKPIRMALGKALLGRATAE